MTDSNLNPRNPYSLSSRRLRLHLSLLLSDPSEFIDRTINAAEARLGARWAQPHSYMAISFDQAIELLERALNKQVSIYMDERQLHEIEEEVDRRAASIADFAPFPLNYSADTSLARLAYAVCRATQPAAVLEVGVAYGKTSAYILKALQVNRTGQLHSIDLPALVPDLEPHLGFFVPESLRENWYRYRGSSRKLLPRVLQQIDGVSLTILDGLHTKRNITRELRLIDPCFSSPAVALVDDVHLNSGFKDWASDRRLLDWAAVEQRAKDNYFGIAIHDERRRHQLNQDVESKE